MSQIDQTKPQGETSGFNVQLRGASLWDLVQMECMALSHRVVKITTSNDIGYIYFSGGQIIHAETKSMAGEEAALQVLSWDEGSFEICDREWPARETIQCHWQSLVMRAAHERDEKQGSVSNLLVFPNTEAGNPNPGGSMLQQPGDPLLSSSDLVEAGRVAPDGTVLADLSKTGTFTDLTSYTTQLVDLIGNSLGLSGFQEMQCEFKTSRCLFFLDPSGNYVGARPQPSIPMPTLRQRLGLQ